MVVQPSTIFPCLSWTLEYQKNLLSIGYWAQKCRGSGWVDIGRFMIRELGLHILAQLLTMTFKRSAWCLCVSVHVH